MEQETREVQKKSNYCIAVRYNRTIDLPLKDTFGRRTTHENVRVFSYFVFNFGSQNENTFFMASFAAVSQV